MKKSLKAALLSGLIFPGIGHLMLKQHLRGSVLMVSSLIALWAIVNVAYQRALAIVDRINSGDIPFDTGAIAEAVSDPGVSAGSLTENISLLVLLACWLIGIIDSYRLGIAQEKQAHDP